MDSWERLWEWPEKLPKFREFPPLPGAGSAEGSSATNEKGARMAEDDPWLSLTEATQRSGLAREAIHHQALAPG